MTTEKDLVLIYFEDTPMVYARIEDITADVKPGWYVVKLMILSIPADVTHWILRDSYIDGAEFTMNGKRMRLEKVECPDDIHLSVPEDDSTKEISGISGNIKAGSGKNPGRKKSEKTSDSENKNAGRVISLTDRFKK